MISRRLATFVFAATAVVSAHAAANEGSQFRDHHYEASFLRGPQYRMSDRVPTQQGHTIPIIWHPAGGWRSALRQTSLIERETSTQRDTLDSASDALATQVAAELQHPLSAPVDRGARHVWWHNQVDARFAALELRRRQVDRGPLIDANHPHHALFVRTLRVRALEAVADQAKEIRSEYRAEAALRALAAEMRLTGLVAERGWNADDPEIAEQLRVMSTDESNVLRPHVELRDGLRVGAIAVNHLVERARVTGRPAWEYADGFTRWASNRRSYALHDGLNLDFAATATVADWIALHSGTRNSVARALASAARRMNSGLNHEEEMAADRILGELSLTPVTAIRRAARAYNLELEPSVVALHLDEHDEAARTSRASRSPEYQEAYERLRAIGRR